jgi:ribosomal protein L29
MAKKKTDYKDMDPKDRTKRLGELRAELRKLRFEAAGARPKDSNAPKKTRREIARLLTAIRAGKTA